MPKKGEMRPRRPVRALANRRRAAACERGYTLVELITVLAILGTVLAAITSVFVAASRAEVDMNQRFRAQQEARLALDKLRREVHFACKLALGSSPPSVTLSLRGDCVTGAGTATWCTVGSGTRWALWRYAGAACSGSGIKSADYLTRGDIFSYTAASPASRAKLHVELPVDVDTTDSKRAYALRDDLVLRNTDRA